MDIKTESADSVKILNDLNKIIKKFKLIWTLSVDEALSVVYTTTNYTGSLKHNLTIWVV